MDAVSIATIGSDPSLLQGTLAERYTSMLARAGQPFVRIARALIASKGPTLVHCTAGKDRTGIAIAVLLAAVGVTREQIIADYIETGRNMDRVLARIASSPALRNGAQRLELIAECNPELLSAPRRAISAALDELDEQGGACRLLRSCGMTMKELEALQRRLVSAAQPVDAEAHLSRHAWRSSRSG
jgi:hypothetical protein